MASKLNELKTEMSRIKKRLDDLSGELKAIGSRIKKKRGDAALEEEAKRIDDLRQKIGRL